MTKLRVLAENLHDLAILTATSELLSASFTQRSSRSYRWRSNDRNDQIIEASMLTPQYIDCLAIARHNLGAAGSVRIEALMDGQTVFDSGVIEAAMLVPAGVWRAGIDPFGDTYNARLPSEASLLTYWFTPTLADSYRITFSTSEIDKSGFFEVGRIFVGLSISPSINYDWKASLTWQEAAEHRETEAGSLRTIGRGHKRRILSFQLSWLTEEDRQVLLTNLTKVGMGADLLVSLFPEVGGLQELEHSMICRRDSPFEHTHIHYKTWQTPLTFKEV